MNLLLRNTNLNLFLIFFIGITFFSCITPSGPNEPFSGSSPKSLEALAKRNLQLALEIRKLPEIIDGINKYEEAIIDKLLAVYEKYPDEFDHAFFEMDKTGKSAYRKYCTPLQALFWFAENEGVNELVYLVKDYKLKNLLSVSWIFQTKFEIEKLDISESQASHILAFVDKKTIWYAKHQKSALKTLLYCYNRTPKAIPEKFRKAIENMPEVKSALRQFKNNQNRWSKTQEVVDRLNDPMLLNYYINKNIRYSFTIGGYHQPIKSTIKLKRGDCDDMAYFGKIVLSRAGYKVQGRIVGCTGGFSDVHIGLIIELEDGRYLLAVNFRTLNSMTGPFDTLLEADKSLGYGSGYPCRSAFHFNW